MPDYTVKTFDEMEPLLGGFFRRARASLGASSFGMQVLHMPAGAPDAYPNHDHADTGMEEIYIVLSGAADFQIEGVDEPLHLEPESAIRVGPTTHRKITPGPDGAKILAIGGVPGSAYEPPAYTELGGPDPVVDPARIL
jgi:mannose-6-phosphate isomerase-like protein (cupin superfamily)